MKRRKLSVVVLAVVSMVTLLVPVQAAFASTTGSTVTTPISRLAGTDRFATAVQISQAGWEDNSSQYAVLSAGMDDNLVDALTAAPLAKLKNAPILLTQGDKLNDDTKTELQRLGVTTVYVTSGIGVIKQPVLDELKAMNITVVPLGGSDRFATALNIANEVGVHGKVVVASANGNADALSIAPIAAAMEMPILLTGKDKLPDNVASYLDNVKADVQETYVVGGTGVMSETVENSLPQPVRLGGANRFDTNDQINRNFTLNFPLRSSLIYVANGGDEHLVDSLTGSVLAAKNNTSIVLTSNPMPETTKEALSDMFPMQGIVALGGESLVPDSDLEPMSTYTNYTDNDAVIGGEDSANPLALSGKVQIAGDNSTLQNATIDGVLCVTGNNVKLSNVNLTGALVFAPGSEQTATLDNVNAAEILMDADAKGTYQLNDVNTQLLVSQGSQTKLALGGNTAIQYSMVMSDSTLDAGNGAGTFGNVIISGTPSDDGNFINAAVQLSGSFQDPVMVSGPASVAVMPGTTVNEVAIAPDNENDKITLQGAITELDVVSESQIEVLNDSTISNVNAYANTTITVDQTAVIGGVTKLGGAVVTLNGDGAQNVGGTSE